ncbi:hypothetical protein I4O61_000330, partial [Clostridioides difficile]
LIMKEVNAYYRKHGKLDGCALLSPDQIEKLKASMASSWRSDPRHFESYQLTNNNAEIRRVKARIEQLSKMCTAGIFRLGVRWGSCGNEPGGQPLAGVL